MPGQAGLPRRPGEGVVSKLTDLQQFRLEPPVEPKAKPPRTNGFEGTILAIDQAVAESPWAVIRCPGFQVTAQGSVKTESRFVGHEGTLDRAATLYRFFIETIEVFEPDVVVHEMPPVAAYMSRPESSLVAATALRLAVAHLESQGWEKDTVRMVASQHAKKVVTGNGNAKKKEVKEALIRRYPDLAKLKPFNQGIADALALAHTVVEEWEG